MEQLICDLTQSFSEKGGGIRTYLLEKQRFIIEQTPHRYLLIIPGARDELVKQGRATIARIASPPVPGSPNYRLLLSTDKIGAILERFRPNVIECLDAFVVAWTALGYARSHPETLLLAGYATDFPKAYARRAVQWLLGARAGAAAERIAYAYCRRLYQRFDAVYPLSEAGGGASLRELGLTNVHILPLGVDTQCFTPFRRDLSLRKRLGTSDEAPILVYAGRIDRERRCATVVDAFMRLPEKLGATLVMIGEGAMREPLVSRCRGRRVHFPGYISDRNELATVLASSDIYVSAMADETFGAAVLEAQACGLPIVGVAAGAMIERVPEGTGLLGPVDDVDAMAANILAIWRRGAAAMGARGRAHVEHFYSWEATFTRLFDQIYPSALLRKETADRRAAAASANFDPALRS
jgi:alpha-1,6-mannosyltransferase